MPELETFIRVYDDVLSRSHCDQLIATFRSSPLVHRGEAQLDSEAPDSHKVCDELHIREVYLHEKRREELAKWRRVDQQLFDLVNPKMVAYLEEFEHLVGQPIKDEGFRFKRYPAGSGRFGLHLDQTPTTPTRVLAILLYLNDVEEGGATRFHRQGIDVQPKAGRLCIAPPFWTHPHEGLTPVSNDKYVVNNFAIF